MSDIQPIRDGQHGNGQALAFVEVVREHNYDWAVPTCTGHEETWRGPKSGSWAVAQANADVHNIDQHEGTA